MTPKLIILYLVIFLLGSCSDNSRTPSKQRLESTSQILLPATFNVIKDEFQDMGQDYAVYYDLTFNGPSTIKLTESIKNSPIYRFDGSAGRYSDSSQKGNPNDFSVWFPVINGFEFKGKDGDVLYSVIVDTTKGSLKYHEYVL